MYRCPMSSSLATASRQHGGVLFWMLIILIGAAIGAFVVIHWAISNVKAQLLATDTPLKAYVDQPLEVTASVLNDLKISIDEVVSTSVPVDTVINVPVDEPLKLFVSLDTMVPVRTSVTVDDVIPLNQMVDIDTVVEADLLGETFQLPLRGTFPVRASVPVRLEVPIDQLVRVKFDAPVSARLKQDLKVPLKTDIVAQVPLQAQMSVPVLNDLKATAILDKDPALALDLDYADLVIPLSSIGIGFDKQTPQEAAAAEQANSNSEDTP